MPVWRELVADTVTPVGAFLQLVGTGDTTGFLLESVEGGERWGRYSFVGRNPLATLVAQGHHVTTRGNVDLDALVGGGVTGHHGVLAALEAILDAVDSPDLPDLPPLHAGLVGYLGYDVVREVEHLPDIPPDDLGQPDAVLCVIGQLAAFDHWRQRVVLIDNVVVDPAWGDAELDAAHAAAEARLDAARRRLRPTDSRGPAAAATPAGAAGRRGADHDRRRSTGTPSWPPRSTCWPATSSRSCCPSASTSTELGADPFDVYRVLRLVNPSPYLYFLRFPEVTVVGASPEPMVRLRDGTVTSRPIAGSRPRGTTPGGGRPPRGRAGRGPEGGGRARHADRPGPQRRRPGGDLRHRGGRRGHGGGALQPHHAPDLPGVRHPGARARARSTCSGRRCPPARCRGRRRCGPWRSSTTSSPPSAASTAAWSATSTSAATSTRPSPSGP